MMENKLYKCMVCGRMLDSTQLPIISKAADGCCTAGSLIEYTNYRTPNISEFIPGFKCEGYVKYGEDGGDWYELTFDDPEAQYETILSGIKYNKLRVKYN